MNLTDLKQVLDDRSGDPAEHVTHHLRLHGVRAKVVARRRRRIATWTTCAVVALAGLAAAAVVPGLRTDVTPTPADSPTPSLAPSSAPASSAPASRGNLSQVPDVRGLTKDQASRILEDAGYKVRARDGVEVPRDQAGKVSAQSPNPGMKLAKGERVTIEVDIPAPEVTESPPRP
ncbi:PASTA domain-containing protein [Micromonospora sp. NBC_00898]|uniref:PASTA domain-containing protein n=1 Tax=Micromonospora sp. NBC_00898 TaxID=2975981 RepID=UPI00386BA658|nr:PASTA domain-containing protein [Micromonospora sp. NBC_00898]